MPVSESDRLLRLEERVAWLQRHVTEQDKAMLEMADELAKLRAELLALRERHGGGASAGDDNPADERPPHY